MFLPGENAVLVMLQVIEKILEPGDMVVDPLMRIRATARECLLKPKHWMFICCHRKRNCFRKTRPSLLETLTNRVFNKYFHIVESAEVQNAGGTYLEKAAQVYRRSSKGYSEV